MEKISPSTRFEIKITLIYTLTSIIGTICISLLVLTLCRFRKEELELLLIVLALDLPVVGLLQGWVNRRWLAQTFHYLENLQAVPSPGVYQEILEFPWKGSLLSLGLWGVSLLAIVLTRILFLDPFPLHRTLILSMATISGALLAWPLQYFLFHRVIRTLLDTLPTPQESFSFRNLPIVRKYSLLFAAILLGTAIFGATLFSGILYNALLQRVYKSTRNLFLLQSQQLLLGPNESPNQDIALFDHPSPDALPVENFLEERGVFFGIPVYSYEIQEIPPSWAFYLPVKTEEKIRYLEYRLNTASLRSQAKELYLQMTLLSLFLIFSFVFILLFLFMDLTRPIRNLRRALLDPRVPYQSPDLFLSDDELLETMLMVRQMFLRFQKLTQRVSELFWRIKDQHREISHVLAGSLQSFSDQEANLKSVAQDFNNFREKTYDQLQFKESFLTTLRETTQKLPFVRAQWEKYIHHFSAPTHTIEELQRRNEQILHILEQCQSSHQHLMPRISYLLDDIKEISSLLDRLQELLRSHTDSLSPLLGENRVIRDLSVLRESSQDETPLLGNAAIGSAQIGTLLIKLDEFLNTSQSQIQEIMRICETIDILGFEALIVSTQERGEEVEFRVVGEEVRDLARRARGDMSFFAQDLLSTYAALRDFLKGIEKCLQDQRDYSRSLQELHRRYRDFTLRVKEEMTPDSFSPLHLEPKLEEKLHFLNLRVSAIRQDLEEKSVELRNILLLLQELAERHREGLGKLSAESNVQKREISATDDELNRWINRLSPFENRLNSLGRIGTLMANQLDRCWRSFAAIRDSIGQKNEWWINIKIQLESVGQEIGYREGLMKRITQEITRKK